MHVVCDVILCSSRVGGSILMVSSRLRLAHHKATLMKMMEARKGRRGKQVMQNGMTESNEFSHMMSYSI